MEKQKPVSLMYNEFKQNLEKCINESGLPAFIVAPCLKDAYEAVKSLELQQLQRDLDIYNKEVNAYGNNPDV
jgi:hypothetical protein